jgi:ActR/RegA family two-component response regulator
MATQILKPPNAKRFPHGRIITRKFAATPTLVQAEPSLAKVEWDYIQRTLGDCGGNISQAARRLRLHRRTLQRKLAKLAPMT